MKTVNGIELKVKRDGSVIVRGRKVGAVSRDDAAPAAGFAAYADGKRLSGGSSVQIGDGLSVWIKKGDAVAAVLLADAEARNARRREAEAERRREVLIAVAILNVVAEADSAAELPMTPASRQTFELELENPERVSFSVRVELAVDPAETWTETVTIYLELERWGNAADEAKLSWAGTSRTLESTRACISLYQTALVLAERMKRAADDARAALAEGRCPVHGDAFSDDGTCQSCYQDLIASKVCSG